MKRYMIVTTVELEAESEDDARMKADNDMPGLRSRYSQEIREMKPYDFHWVAVVVADMDLVGKGFNLTKGDSYQAAREMTQPTRGDSPYHVGVTVTHAPMEKLIQEMLDIEAESP